MRTDRPARKDRDESPLFPLAAGGVELDFSGKGSIFIEAFQYHLDIFNSSQNQTAEVIL